MTVLEAYGKTLFTWLK